MQHVFTSAGDPGLFTARLHDAGMTVVHVVGSLNGARKAVDAGVDALVVEGVEGGGFKSALGASTTALLPLIADEVDLPLIAAGGICDAPSAAAAVVLGALKGVQMGTRMLASREAAVHANFKDAIVAADDAGTILLNLPGNPTMRVLHVGLARRVATEGAAAPLISGVTAALLRGRHGGERGQHRSGLVAHRRGIAGRRRRPQHVGRCAERADRRRGSALSQPATTSPP